eukprot:11144892-Alexandrium_andersonii.AAC.1
MPREMSCWSWSPTVCCMYSPAKSAREKKSAPTKRTTRRKLPASPAHAPRRATPNPGSDEGGLRACQAAATPCPKRALARPARPKTVR